jgi:DegV family protein with EDD domain
VPSPGEFTVLYQPLVADPADEVISVHISAAVSGMVGSARAVAQELAPGRIHVVDSRTSAVGLMIMVLATGEAITEGRSVPEILTMLDRMVAESCTYFTVEDPAYLHKGGRFRAASQSPGAMVRIKPILHMHEGKMVALDKARTSSRARRRVVEGAAAFIGDRPARVCVGHVQAPAAAKEIAARIRERMNCVALYTQEMGPVVGSHLGPGAVAVGACPVGADGV